MVIWCGLRQLDWFNEETSKNLHVKLFPKKLNQKNALQRIKKGIHIEWNVECIVIWGLSGYFDALPTSVNPGFLLGFGNPPSLFYQLYLLKILKNDHPAKQPPPLREFFNESNPRDIGPPTGGEVSPTWRKSLTKSMAAKHSTATRPQPPTAFQ